MQALVWIADSLGQQPLAWSPPDGYPDVAASWQSAGGTLGRWNTHLSLAAHWWPDELTQPPLRSLLPDRLPRTHGALVDALAQATRLPHPGARRTGRRSSASSGARRPTR